jgi:hypothetical protein
MRQPPTIPPDTTDWTVVIDQGCGQCGFRIPDVRHTGALLRAALPAWRAALARADATERPAPTVWSPVEYACHVRDTCRVFQGRLEQMLTSDDPVFAYWDQNTAAIEGDYFQQRPAQVLDELTAEIETTAAAFDAVRPDQWERPGRRSDGWPFSVRTFATYLLHDVGHHVHDVSR